jgi:AcrR family transcriptional regulator
MGRWEPNARGRLERAALELYTERGFEQTTVADIAERAGLTKRTFFRHFTDKRDVLFSGAIDLKEQIVRAIVEAPEGTTPIAAVAGALDGAAIRIEERREDARARRAAIAANPELWERELVKLATIGTAVAEALRGRGVTERTASLTAEAGVAAFKVAHERWGEAPEVMDLRQLLKEAFEALKDAVSEQ